jgi:hypothetical protein
MHIPNKIQIILAGVWIWTLITQYIAKLTFKMVQTLIYLSLKTSIPITTLGPQILSKTRQQVEIIKAYTPYTSSSSTTSKELTSQLNLFLNWYWDSEMCDDMGGISINQLSNILPDKIKNSMLHILYKFTFRYNGGLKPFKYENTEELMSQFKLLVLDLKNATMNILPVLEQNSTTSQKDILFNQLSFNPEFSY